MIEEDQHWLSNVPRVLEYDDNNRDHRDSHSSKHPSIQHQT